jgi:hypothetical protein
MIDERRVALARMTSPEAAEALAGAEVALIPVGATEQHGPNMSLETDTAVAYQLALHTAAALHPRAVVTPPLPYGVSYHHMSFPGTMTLSPETFQAVVLEVVESLRQHGVERFFIIDGHAGNQGALDVLMTKLRFQKRIRAAYLFYFTIVDDLMREGAQTARWDTPVRWKRRWGWRYSLTSCTARRWRRARYARHRCRTATSWSHLGWACRSRSRRSRRMGPWATPAKRARSLACN